MCGLTGSTGDAAGSASCRGRSFPASPIRSASNFKAEVLRAARERPNNPDAVDLAMRGWASLNSGFAETNFDAAIADFERALQLDPELTRAQLGLAWGLVDRAFSFRGGHATVDVPRAEALLTNALAKEPNNAWAHFVKADLLVYRRRVD